MTSVAVLDSFGTCSSNFVEIKDSIFLKSPISHIDKIKLIKEEGKSILKTGKGKHNYVLINKYIYELIGHGFESFQVILWNLFNEHTNELKIELQNNLTVDNFEQMYKKYYENSITLKNSVWFFDEHVFRKKKEDSPNFSLIALMRNVAFYGNVINTSYDYKGQNLHLYEVLNKEIETMMPLKIHLMIKLIDLHSKFKKLAYVSEDKTLFNETIDDKFMSEMGESPEFVKKITSFIHDNMRGCKESDDKIKSLLKVTNNFKHKEMFELFYRKYMEDRLLDPATNIYVERECLNLQESTSQIYRKMKYMVEDIEESRKLIRVGRKMEIQVESDKNKGFDVTKMNKNLFNALFLRFYAWDSLYKKEPVSYTVPSELSPYLDMCKGYYAALFPSRKLTWHFDNSVGCVKATFGKNEYMFRVTLGQMFVLMMFNKKKFITIREIKDTLGIKISQVQKLINSLIKGRLLNREQSTKDNLDMTISYNDKFKLPAGYEDTKYISLIPNDTQTVTKVKDVEDEYKIGKMNILKAALVRYLKTNKNKLITEVKTNLVSMVLFKYTDALFDTVMARVCLEGFAEKSDDGLSIIYADGSESDVEEDDVTEDEDDDISEDESDDEV
jgi:hypothetical protein